MDATSQRPQAGAEVFWEVRGGAGWATEVISPLWLEEAARAVAEERGARGLPAAVWEVQYDWARGAVLGERLVSGLVVALEAA